MVLGLDHRTQHPDHETHIHTHKKYVSVPTFDSCSRDVYDMHGSFVVVVGGGGANRRRNSWVSEVLSVCQRRSYNRHITIENCCWLLQCWDEDDIAKLINRKDEQKKTAFTDKTRLYPWQWLTVKATKSKHIRHLISTNRTRLMPCFCQETYYWQV